MYWYLSRWLKRCCGCIIDIKTSSMDHGCYFACNFLILENRSSLQDTCCKFFFWQIQSSYYMVCSMNCEMDFLTKSNMMHLIHHQGLLKFIFLANDNFDARTISIFCDRYCKLSITVSYLKLYLRSCILTFVSNLIMFWVWFFLWVM